MNQATTANAEPIALAPERNQIESECQPLLEQIGTAFEWTWDSRHNALLSEFSSHRRDEILPILLSYFPEHRCRKSIKNLKKSIRKQYGVFAELDEEQMLLCKDSGDQQLVAAWWPWGHGGTISVRIRLQDIEEPTIEEAQTGITGFFKKLFGG